MSYWPFWLVALGLTAVPLVHWFWLRRMFAVSGRYTSVVDAALADGAIEEPPAMSQEDLIAALRDATVSAFGDGAVGVAGPAAVVVARPRQSIVDHVLFFASLVAGGALARCVAGGNSFATGGTDPMFRQVFGSSPTVAAGVLLVGGLFVGFGTRMAGGCTSGHGLCGTSRLQPGSLVATACFFGAGIAASFLLQAVR